MRKIIDGVRSVLFTSAFFGFTTIMMILAIPGVIMPLRIQRAISMAWFAMVYACEKYIMGLDYHVVGGENLPPAPYIIACKHQSAWETMKVYHIFGDRTAIVAKKGLLDIPVWGHYGSIMGLVPVDRSKGKEALALMTDKAREAISEGRCVLVFPQGTRVPVGEKRPYKAGAMKLYEGLNVPLVPVAINAGLFWPKNSFWKRSGRITVEILPAIQPGLPSDVAFERMVSETETASDRLGRLPVGSNA